MILDLVSPWLAAVEASDSTRARSAFRNRHATLLEAIRLARAPAFDVLRLATDPDQLHILARRAADPATQQLLRTTLSRAVEFGADRCSRVVLLAGDGGGDCTEPLPRSGDTVALFIEQIENDQELVVSLARAVGALTRWAALDGSARTGRNRWEAAPSVALREWIYTEGVALHLAVALLPDVAPHRLLGVNHTAFNRMREREKVFRALLDADLDERGIGLMLRWLTPGAPIGPRTIGNVVLPPMVGRYLAWRMTAERVERIGLREALRAEA